MNVVVRPIEPFETDTWDELVASAPAGSLFHTSLWQEVIRTEYGGGDYLLLGAFAEGILVGGFCALVRRRLGVLTAVAPLLTPYSGFLLSGQLPGGGDAGHEVLDALAMHLKKFRYQFFQCAPGLTGAEILEKYGYAITPRRTLEINLSLPEEEIWSNFSGAVRRNVKKAKRADYEITGGWDAPVGYQLFEQNFLRRNEKCPVDQRFFTALAQGKVLEPYRRRYCAWRDGKLKAFVVALRYEKRVYYALAAADDDALKAGVPSLLIWDLLREHGAEGFEQFDFLGGNTPGIAKFKMGFNPDAKSHVMLELVTSRRIGFGRGIRKWLQ